MAWSMVLLVAAATMMSIAECWEEVPTKGATTGVIRVGGKVLCQDCTEGWNEWVDGQKPIEGCVVSVTCMDERKRITYYGSDKTDKAGEYELTINKYIHGKEIKPEACFTRLVSSPDPICNIPTDFAGGKTGVKLGRPTLVYRDMIKHVLDPFYYTTPMCDEPDTNDDEQQNNY
ncbi:pollen Ole e 1 allergen and extensin family protein [Artemisia annua]|uniref:Pollen Ole e 1 allergen and extensin family protein n=1 Tax=Artemisia annua TaxID=35608 RepID=A0A2U1NC68_ARTAN|nr:pollen Ole e 1 allergen and extensin family protein [Artemisia annua]